MGWLFGNKKKRSVPFPEPRMMDEDTLQFPQKAPSERVIRPEEIKGAAGFNRPLLPPTPSANKKSGAPVGILPEDRLSMLPRPSAPPKPQPSTRIPTKPVSSGPFYMKVQAYQRVLGEIESIRTDLGELQNTNRHLENSEYNEENHFSKLKRTIKTIHDDLVEVDSRLFKNEGE